MSNKMENKLTDKDIRELGWHNQSTECSFYRIGNFQIEKTKKGKHSTEDNYWTIIEWHRLPDESGNAGMAYTLFSGTIGNKSELEKLMTQTGVTYGK